VAIKISWDPVPLRQFETAMRFIARDSTQNAEKVRKIIIDKTNQLLKHPDKHSPDKHKKNNDGRFRAFELHHYRISYFIGNDVIRIIRFRHTSMEPKKY
jgi:plasmid stabilization system protein ParE